MDVPICFYSQRLRRLNRKPMNIVDLTTVFRKTFMILGVWKEGKSCLPNSFPFGKA